MDSKIALKSCLHGLFDLQGERTIHGVAGNGNAMQCKPSTSFHRKDCARNQACRAGSSKRAPAMDRAHCTELLTPTSCRTSTSQLVKPRAQRELWTTLPKPKRHVRPKQKPRLGVVPKLTHQGHLRQRLRHQVPQVVQVLHHLQHLALLKAKLHTSRCPQRRNRLGHLLPTNHNKRPVQEETH